MNNQITIESRRITITNDGGLRSKPVILFVSALNCFRRTEIKMSHSNKTVNAKSLLGILSLGLERGAVADVTARGPKDEVQSALDKIQSMAEAGFTEEACK